MPTMQGTIWAQWVHGVSAGATQTVTVNMNKRVITAYASIRSYDVFITHPAQHYIGPLGSSVPPSLEYEHGYAKISELLWLDDNDNPQHSTGSWPYIVGGRVTQIKFKAYNTDALFVINYWE